MKKIIFSSILLAVVLLSCNQNNKEKKTVNKPTTELAEEKYSCPMDPEETGKKGDTCKKCGMDLQPQKEK